ncbi:MAG: hypothetical protein ACLGHX_07815 [Acidimicrobiia bacterium]
MDIFSGTLILDDGARVPVELGVDDENLTLRTGGRQIGTWPIKYCRVSPSGRGAVLLSLDGEKAGFEPKDVARFSAVAAQRFRASSLADRINVIRNLPAAGSEASEPGGRREGTWFVRNRRWVGLALGVFGLFAVSVVALAVLSGDDQQAPAFTVPESVDALPAPPLFDQTTEEFTREWNLTATAFDVPVQIRGTMQPGVFESVLARHLTLQGRTDSDGTIRSLVLVIDPEGDADSDQLALGAIGVAIAVANPELDRDGRAAVLADMGLDVRNPQLDGLDGETIVGDVRYSITFYTEFSALLFTVESA